MNNEFNYIDCTMKCPNLGRCKGEYCALNTVFDEVKKEAPDSVRAQYIEILSAIKEGKNIFITASAGCGKSFLLNSIKRNIPKLTVTASTGIAALNIGGVTLHSALGVGLANKPVQYTVQNLSKAKIDEIRKINFLAIDEISMISGRLLNYCNEFLKMVNNNSQPFGGVQVILIGDFCQLPPVKTSNIKDYDFAFLSKTWQELELETFRLTHNFRQQDDNKLTDILEHFRNGKVTSSDIEILKSREIEPPDSAPRLFPVNVQVDGYNNERLKKENNKIYTNEATFRCLSEKIAPFKDVVNKYIDNMRKNSITPDKLYLCKGARIMLTRNIDKDMVNGSLGYVKEIQGDDKEITKLVVRLDNNIEKEISKVAQELFDAKGEPLISMEQYPCKLAYSASVHKMQGQTLSECFIDFERFFEVNQAYVALSRVKTLQGLYVKNLRKEVIKHSQQVIDFQSTLD